MAPERITSSAETPRPYQLDFLSKKDDVWYLIDSTFGVIYDGLGNDKQSRLVFICDERIGILRENAKNKNSPKPPRARISTLVLSRKDKENILFDTEQKHLIRIYQHEATGRVAQIDIKSTQPITVQQVPSAMEVFAILEQKLAQESGKSKLGCNALGQDSQSFDCH